MRSANDVFGKAGFGHRRQPSSAHRPATGRRALEGILCYAAAGAAILFLVAVVLLVGH